MRAGGTAERCMSLTSPWSPSTPNIKFLLERTVFYLSFLFISFCNCSFSATTRS